MKNQITAIRLREALSEKNMSQQELSDKTGINKASISQYVNGSHKPSNISSTKIWEVLNVNPLWLMGFSVSKNDSLHKSDIIGEIIKEKNIAVEVRTVHLELIDLFNKLDDKGKEKLMEYANDLVKLYPKK